MKKLSLKNTKSMLSRKEMSVIMGNGQVANCDSNCKSESDCNGSYNNCETFTCLATNETVKRCRH
jgi:hypothetical protein